MTLYLGIYVALAWRILDISGAIDCFLLGEILFDWGDLWHHEPICYGRFVGGRVFYLTLFTVDISWNHESEFLPKSHSYSL